MPAAVVQQNFGSGVNATGGLYTATLSTAPPSTSSVIIAVGALQGASFTVAGFGAADIASAVTCNVAIFSAAGNGVTASWLITNSNPAGSDGWGWAVFEVSDLKASPLDRTVQNTFVASTATLTASGAASAISEFQLMIYFGNAVMSAGSSTPYALYGASPYGGVGAGSTDTGWIGYQITTAMTTPTNTMSWTTSSSGDGVLATYAGTNVTSARLVTDPGTVTFPKRRKLIYR